MEKTIAAISTPLAAGGLGVIRISGHDAVKVAGRVFRPVNKGKSLEDLPGYAALYGRVYGDDGDIDEAVALVFLGPKSYTGENVVELSCHGGPVVLRQVLKAVIEAGAVPADRGEFTKRAFLNGKIDLTQAESVMELISAQGGQAAKAALAGRDGVLAGKIGAIKEMLLETAAHLSAWADYPEEDLPQVEPELLQIELNNSSSELRALLDRFQAGKAIMEGVRTVIVGRPNVGKSTLMNMLAGCERSIVTEYAGTTRDIVEDTIVLANVPILLADTAGLRETNDPVESIGVQRARRKLEEAQLVFAVFDSSQTMEEEDRKLVEQLRGFQSIAVINKSDLKGELDLNYINSNFQQVVQISAVNGEGLSELETAVAAVLETAGLDPTSGILFNERQREAAANALNWIDEAIHALNMGVTLDAVTVSIEAAVASLLELTGERASEAVVEQVFSHFCVGK